MHPMGFSLASKSFPPSPMLVVEHMQDLKEAKRQYSQLVQRLISNGTTTAMVFGSLHLEPTMLLADILHQVRELRCAVLCSAVSTPEAKTAAQHRALAGMI